MRYTKPQPPQQSLRKFFDYEDDAVRAVNGFTMRGGLLRRVPPIRIVTGTLRADEPTARASAGVRGYGTHYLHRLIWIWHHGPIPERLVVDHRDGDPSHNRIGNLRLATDSQNQFNRRRSREGASVPYIGVCSASGGYNAFTSDAGKPIYLGFFADPIDAALARDAEAERRASGFAGLNRDLFPEVCARHQPKTTIST